MAKSFDDLVLRTTSKATRDRGARRARRLMTEMLLAELRSKAGVSQRELARALGIKQPSLSKLEHQDNMRIGTLRRLIEALGGRLDVVARFPHGSARLAQFDARPRSAKSASRKRAA